MGALIRRAAAVLLGLAAAALLGTVAFAAAPATPSPSPGATPSATPAPTPTATPAATPSPSASGAADCGVTNFQNCLQTSTSDVTQTIWNSMTKLVADAARNVIVGLGCELTITGSPDVPGSSTAVTPLCAGQPNGANSRGLLSPDLTGAYFSQYYQRAAIVAALIALGVGMAAAAFFAVTRNGMRLAYAGLGYPSLVAIGIVVAPGLLATILRLTDDLGFFVAGPSTLSTAFQNLSGIYQMPPPAGAPVGGGPPPVFVILVTSLAAVLFGLVGIIELLARSVAVYLVVLFWPLALASSAWGGGFGLARRFLRVIVAVILAKPVMVIVLSLGVGLIATTPLDLISMIEGVMLLLVALLAPLVPFALFGGAESAIAGQVQFRGRLDQALGGGGETVVQAGSVQVSANGSGGLPASPVAIAPAAGGGRGRAILRRSTDGSVEGSS
jgi:hypothetical protein